MKKGIDRNNSPEKTSPDYIYWAKNSINSESFDAFINERGTAIEIDFSSLNINFFAGWWAIGNIIVFLYKDNNNKDVIAAINEDNNLLTVKLVRNDLNFDINHPVKIRGKYNALGQLKIVLYGDLNPVRYINIDTALASDPISLYGLFPISKNPNISINSLDGAGNVLTGQYFVAIRYLTVDRTQSGFSPLSPPLNITNISNSAPFTGNSAFITGKATNKGIQITLTNVDTAYNKIQVAIISQISGTIATQIVKEVNITSSTINTIYNGTEFLSLINLEDVIVDNPIYTSAKVGTDINDELLLADLTTDQSIDYQTIANYFVIEWTSDRTVIDPFSDSSRKAKGRTFMHEEVYAMYVQFELTSSGKFTDWFHIPGPAMTSGDNVTDAVAVTYSGGLKFGTNDPLVFQTGDTSGAPIYDPINNYYHGTMGKWENQNEVYPANFPVYAGQKVRHHKFPSIKKMNDAIGSNDYSSRWLDYLGIRVDNSVIGATLANYPAIKGYRIGYAKRNLSEQSVIGQTIVQYGANDSANPNSIINPGGNWSKEINSAGYTYTVNKNYVRLNAFDTLLDKPSIGNIYLSNLVKFRVNNLDSSILPTIFYGRLANSTGLNASTVYSTASNFNETFPLGVKTVIPTNELIRKLNNSKYIPQNVLYSVGGVTVDNLNGEETLFAQILGPNLSLDVTGLHKAHDANSSPGLFEEVYLANIKVPKTDFFLSYKNQTVVPIAFICRDFTVPYNINFIAGDAFIGFHSYMSLSGEKNNPATPPDATKGSRMPKFFLCESWNNSNLRVQIDGDYSTYFYPASGAPPVINSPTLWFSLWDMNKFYNVINYSKDYSTVNAFENSSIFNPDIPDIYLFPYRIIKSISTNKDNTLTDGWNAFKANNYYESIRNKGKIINLENWANDNLLIHHERALYITRDTGILQTGSLPITLGSGDLFDIRPREQNGTSFGIAGTQHKYSCLLFDGGYVFADAIRGQVFLYTGQECRDLTKGFRTFFRDNLSATQDNPLNSTGITIAFDKDNNRLLLSQKGVKNFVVSYDIIKEEWASAHDYITDVVFNTRRKVYFIKNKQLYRHNIGPRGNFFGVTYPFYVDFIINEVADRQKVLGAIQWLSKYRNSDGSVNQRKGITHVTIWNDQHCTGRIPLVTNETNSLFVTGVNSKVEDETWSFDEFYNRVTDPNVSFISDLFSDFRPLTSNLDPVNIWWKQEPLRGKYFIVRLEYDNSSDNEVAIRELSPTERLSKN